MPIDTNIIKWYYYLMNELTFTQIGELVGVSRQRAHKLQFPDKTPAGVAKRFAELSRAQWLLAADLQSIAMKYQLAGNKAAAMAQEAIE